MTRRVDSYIVNAAGMSYIVQRQARFYVVAYDGLDPLTGRERRRWHPAGIDREEAETLAARLRVDRAGVPPARGGPLRLDDFLRSTWLPHKRRQVRQPPPTATPGSSSTTSHPPSAHVPLRRLRADHLDDLYERPRHDRRPPRPRARPQDRARGPHDRASRARPGRATTTPRPQRRPLRARAATPSQEPLQPGPGAPMSWPPSFGSTKPTALPRAAPRCAHRHAPRRDRRAQVGRPRPLHPPGLVAGPCRASPGDPSSSTSRPAPAGAASTSTPPPSPSSTGGAAGYGSTVSHTARRLDVLQPHGTVPQPRSLSQLFDRVVQRSDLPRIRFHDLRHTHASLLVANGVPIKVVTERLGHAHPGFTMHTYQHLLPGMSAAAAEQFATLVAAATGRRLPAQRRRSTRSAAIALDRAGRHRR